MTEVGASVPVLERQIRLVDMVAYAGATWDFHRLHYDAEYVAAAGMPAPVVDGQAMGAYLAEQVQDWLGPQWRITEMAFRLAAAVYAGETIRVEATVVDAADGEVAVEQSISVGERVVVRGATTRLARR